MCIPVIGLVGGVGSGKSSVARRLGAVRRAVVIDGDEIGHRLLKAGPIQEAVRDRFGNEVFDEQGNVNRAELGRLVFGASPEQRRARADLETILHPRIRDTLTREVERAKASPSVEAVLLDAAVLLEAGWNDLCDIVVFVDVPEPQRRERVRQARGWDDRQLASREQSQLPLKDKRSAADEVIDNSRTLQRAAAQLERILDEARRRCP